MRDVVSEIDRWRAAGERVAVATVVRTWGSAPRREGATMAVAADGKIAGSVSGGCVETSVVEEATGVLETGRPRLLRFGVADETAWEVGLACGGTVEVFVEPLEPGVYDRLRAVIAEEGSAAVATLVAGPEDRLGRKLIVGDDGTVAGSLGDPADDGPAAEAARAALAEGRSRRVRLGAEETGSEVFVDVLLPPPTLVVVGGVHIAIGLTRMARTLGYRTVVIDPRRPFGSEERFPHVDQLLQAWPDDALARVGLGPSTAVAVLTHDPKLDDPALRTALPSRAFYVGALGSRATQAKRRKRLLEAGLTEEQINRLHAPIGLDLGGRAPEEIALSVLAQIVAARNGVPAARGEAQPSTA
jgi:xanthine dehydrogenase accessory factor